MTPPTANQLAPEVTLHEQSAPVLPLVRTLCETLLAEKIIYCHWKSNNALERSASGENDLDLLVCRTHVTRFSEILNRLGFKQARARPEKQLPGVLDYFGHDGDAARLVHVHAHYQLVLGHDMTKSYRLPIERAYLESAVQGDLFKIPAPEFEFIVFVIRMVLKHLTWDAIVGREGAVKAAERGELAYLQARIDQEHVHDILRQHLPYLSVGLFEDCLKALRPSCPVWTRVKTSTRLQSQLRVGARRSLFPDTCLKFSRRAAVAVRRRMSRSSLKYRLVSGGAFIAVVGGDGAGKSTAVDGLCAWLSKDLQTTTIHLGKPRWSATTVAVRGILKMGQLLGFYPTEASFRETLNQESLVSPGYPWLLREVCRARDRYRTYLRAARFAANGGLVVCDRFPLPQIKRMDGPQADRFVSRLISGPQTNRFTIPRRGSRLARFLIALEERYYKRFAPPELVIVLRVDPDVAVERRIDEDVVSVRERSTEIWELDWRDTNAHVVDAGKSKREVLAEMKALIWSVL